MTKRTRSGDGWIEVTPFQKLSPPGRIGLGGGCLWCTEAVFASLKGVQQVEQGFIRSVAPHDAFSEAVLVIFDPAVISLEDLIEIHLRTHSSTSTHSLREKYRSAIYTFNTTDANEANNIIQRLQLQFSDIIITSVLPFVAFKPSLPQYHHYFINDPEKPFCKRYIHPKLELLQKKYSRHLAHGR